ncbi:hypothetical protein EBS02_03810 [bacterium]|nr:hypothetical protein [bacterium]
MLEYEYYQEVLRNPYYPKYVSKRFYEAQEKIGIPNDSERCVWVSVKTKSKFDDWFGTNNALNAFEFQINRKLWMRRSKKEKMPNIGAIETDKEHLKHHFHYLMVLREIQVLLTDPEIETMVRNIAGNLDEVNSRNPTHINIQFFRFDLSKVNSKGDDFGKCLHYCVKSSEEHWDPLERKIYNKQQQKEIYEKNTTILTPIQKTEYKSA